MSGERVFAIKVEIPSDGVKPAMDGEPGRTPRPWSDPWR